MPNDLLFGVLRAQNFSFSVLLVVDLYTQLKTDLKAQ